MDLVAGGEGLSCDIAIVGGGCSGALVVSQLLTLYITPVIYLYLESFQRWLRKPKQGAPRELETLTPA